MSVTASREVERKYEVGPVAALPDLAGLPGVETVAAACEELLEATYVDTADLRLRAEPFGTGPVGPTPAGT